MRGRRTAIYGLAFSVLAAGLLLASTAPADEALDDLLSAFQLTPLGDQKPTPFTLFSLEGKPVSLDAVRGKAAVLLYFWESG